MTVTVVSQTKRRNMTLFGILALLMLVISACSSNSGDDEGFNLKRDYRLHGGDQLDGDQVILAATITLESGSTINGDTTLTGDEVTLNAIVNGDVVVWADTLSLGETAHVTGDLVVCAAYRPHEQARIDGEVKEECVNSGTVSAANLIESAYNSWRGSPLFRLSSVLIGSLLFGALAALSTVLFPRPLVRMSESVQRSPLRAGGLGFLTMLVAIGLTVLYGISLLLVLPVILLPFVVVGWIAIGLLSVLGWVALAVPFGVFIIRLLRIDHQPRMVAAAVGGVSLTLLLRLWSVFWSTAWIGLLATVILGSVGLGAVILTHVGTKSYPRPKHDLTRAATD